MDTITKVKLAVKVFLLSIVVSAFAFQHYQIKKKDADILEKTKTIQALTTELAIEKNTTSALKTSINVQNSSIESWQKQSQALETKLATLPKEFDNLNNRLTAALKARQPAPQDCQGAMQWLRDNAKELHQ